jgi:hypothetical protein
MLLYSNQKSVFGNCEREEFCFYAWSLIKLNQFKNLKIQFKYNKCVYQCEVNTPDEERQRVDHSDRQVEGHLQAKSTV